MSWICEQLAYCYSFSADIYLSRENGDAGPSHRDAGPLTNQPYAGDETAMPVATYTRLEGSIRHNGSIPTLRELVRISVI